MSTPKLLSILIFCRLSFSFRCLNLTFFLLIVCVHLTLRFLLDVSFTLNVFFSFFCRIEFTQFLFHFCSHADNFPSSLMRFVGLQLFFLSVFCLPFPLFSLFCFLLFPLGFQGSYLEYVINFELLELLYWKRRRERVRVELVSCVEPDHFEFCLCLIVLIS